MNGWTFGALVIAQDAGGAPPAPAGGLSDMLRLFAPMILILIVFMWMTHRSQKKKEMEREQMLASIKPRDKVVTIGGIHGRVVNVKEDVFVLRVDEDKDVRITVSRSGVSRKVAEEKGSS